MHYKDFSYAVLPESLIHGLFHAADSSILDHTAFRNQKEPSGKHSVYRHLPKEPVILLWEFVTWCLFSLVASVNGGKSSAEKIQEVVCVLIELRFERE